MNIPQTIQIGCVIYKIIIKQMKNSYGETESPKQEIRLDPRNDEDRMLETLSHELIHAAIYESGAVEYFNSKKVNEELLIKIINPTVVQIIKQFMNSEK